MRVRGSMCRRHARRAAIDHQSRGPLLSANRTDTAGDLLFGMLALQTGLIDQAALVAAFHAWSRDRSTPLADVLERGGRSTRPVAP